MKEDKVVKIGLLFYICSILGYFYELIINYFDFGKIFSHGFFSGPWLPIYGIGAVLISLLYKYRKNPVKIFLLSFIITGTFEGLCGLFLLKVLKKRLWDYTGYFLNINGYVCLLSALVFGIGGLLITYIIIPLIDKLVNKVNNKILKVILVILSMLFLTDVIISIVLRKF